jgi:hypothetical protein
MRTLNIMIAIVCVCAVFVGVQAQAQETRSPLVRQMYNGNFPPEEEAQQLRDELFYNQSGPT